MPETIGELLKKTRLEKRLTLDQVFHVLHIRQRFLEALEANQRELLPSDVQGRGFLRMYAEFLELPVPPLVEAWENNSIILPEPESPDEVISPEEVLPSAQEIPADTSVTIQDDITEKKTEDKPDQTRTDPSSANIFQEIGTGLRKRREILGIPLADIEHHLHIKLHYLRALESGKVDELPSLAQVRGMLGNYAHFLELDGDAMLMRFADAQQARRVERSGPNTSAKSFSGKSQPMSRPSAVKRFLTPDLLVISLVILAFFGFAVWSAVQVNAINTQEQKITPPSIAQVLLVTPSATLDNLTELPDGSMNTPVDEGDITEEVSGNEEPTLVPTLDNLPLQVYVVASQRAWMRIAVDGKVVFDGRVIIGNAYPYSAKTTIELDTGDGSALMVYFNQKNLGKLGIVGQVVNLIFTQGGIVTPTASFSSTPTVTPIFTVTLKPTSTKPTSTLTPLVP